MLQLSEADERALLGLARHALEEAARKGCLAEVAPVSGALEENCGAFVTIHKGGRLRGCIGYVDPLKPLYQTVRECALAAALHDPRFDPVTADELPELRVEISVLSPLQDISIDQLEIGRHGLLVSQGFQRGLLLPQVAVEWEWDRDRFLEEACLKAGLPPGAWRQGARIQAFTARIFGEPAGHSESVWHAA